MERWRSQTNLVTAMFGILMFLSPFLLDFAGRPAGWNAIISGAVLTAVSIAAVTKYSEWEEWIDLAIGLWIFLAPWALAFPPDAASTRVHFMVGTIVVLLAAVELWMEHHRPQPSLNRRQSG